MKAVKDQAEKLWHVSNVFKIPGQEKLAKVLTDATGLDEVFFTNSGAEAIECAIKTARKYHWANGAPERIDIIGFDGSFHGRTLAAVNASGNAAYLEGFGPRMPGFVQLPFGDMEALKAAVGPTTAAIIVEPVQGEGGARALTEQQLQQMRQLCDETGALLATADAAKGMTVGSHGSTYGGNPLAMAVALASMEELSKPELMDHVRELAGYFTQQFNGLKDRYPDVVLDIRGKGLLIGLKLATNNREFMQHARDQHLLVAGGGDNCVRLLPPLTLTLEEAREAVEKLERACETARAKAKAAA